VIKRTAEEVVDGKHLTASSVCISRGVGGNISANLSIRGTGVKPPKSGHPPLFDVD
jgi:hypothetical protein